jgi:hypothetical protein
VEEAKKYTSGIIKIQLKPALNEFNNISVAIFAFLVCLEAEAFGLSSFSCAGL